MNRMLSRISFSLLLLCMSLSAFAVRNEVDRFRLLEDKMMLDYLYRPYGHKFVLPDVSGWYTKNLLDVIDEGKDAADKPTDAEKTTAVIDFLNKYVNTEHFAYVYTTPLEIQLPRFKFGTVGMASSVRLSGNLGTSLSISGTNEDIVINGVSLGTLPDPYVQLYLKNDFELGVNLDFYHRSNWFWSVNPYILQRWDRLEAVTRTQIITDKKVVDLDKPKNTSRYLMTDITFGKKYRNFTGWVGVEELPVFTISDKKDTTGAVIYGLRPKLVAHAQYLLKLPIIMDLKPFAGVHKRSGYSLGDGAYAGVDADFGWFPVSFNSMIDKYYFTFTPRFRLFIFQIEGTLKAPLKSSVDGFKTETIYGANFRISFGF